MVQAHLGYASDRRGNGVAYARLTSLGGERLVRVAFRAQRFSGLDEREVSYAALMAVATVLSERRLAEVEFVLPDQRLIDDRAAGRELPPPLVLPYIRLGCTLNCFKRWALRQGHDPDLEARARAEVALLAAA